LQMAQDRNAAWWTFSKTRHGEADQKKHSGTDPAQKQFFSLHPKPGRTREWKDMIQGDMGDWSTWVRVEIRVCPYIFKKMAFKIGRCCSLHSFL
jgi:hypothetical protein